MYFSQDLTFATSAKMHNFTRNPHESPATPFGGDPVDFRSFSSQFRVVFFCRQADRSTGRTRDAAGKIERASPVNTINQFNPRVERSEGVGNVCVRLRECRLTKAKKENNFGVSVSKFADRANTTRSYRIKTALQRVKQDELG